jgi:hypothetical protein
MASLPSSPSIQPLPERTSSSLDPAMKSTV